MLLWDPMHIHFDHKINRIFSFKSCLTITALLFCLSLSLFIEIPKKCWQFLSTPSKICCQYILMQMGAFGIILSLIKSKTLDKMCSHDYQAFNIHLSYKNARKTKHIYTLDQKGPFYHQAVWRIYKYKLS